MQVEEGDVDAVEGDEIGAEGRWVMAFNEEVAGGARGVSREEKEGGREGDGPSEQEGEENASSDGCCYVDQHRGGDARALFDSFERGGGEGDGVSLKSGLSGRPPPTSNSSKTRTERFMRQRTTYEKVVIHGIIIRAARTSTCRRTCRASCRTLSSDGRSRPYGPSQSRSIGGDLGVVPPVQLSRI